MRWSRDIFNFFNLPTSFVTFSSYTERGFPPKCRCKHLLVFKARMNYFTLLNLLGHIDCRSHSVLINIWVFSLWTTSLALINRFVFHKNQLNYSCTQISLAHIKTWDLKIPTTFSVCLFLISSFLQPTDTSKFFPILPSFFFFTFYSFISAPFYLSFLFPFFFCWLPSYFLSFFHIFFIVFLILFPSFLSFSSQLFLSFTCLSLIFLISHNSSCFFMTFFFYFNHVFYLSSFLLPFIILSLSCFLFQFFVLFKIIS